MKYDHIVVGGGTAGCIVATRLSEDLHRSVLLLEAGPDFPDFAQLPDMLKLGWGSVNLEARAAGSQYNWSFTGTATQEQGPMPVPRGKVLGGSSAINGQTFIRGAPKDRVRGVSCLRIADASIMLDVVRANTNVTTMMIAERASDFIKSGS